VPTKAVRDAPSTNSSIGDSLAYGRVGQLQEECHGLWRLEAVGRQNSGERKKKPENATRLHRNEAVLALFSDLP
jgi:hypothetical protein